MAPILASMLSKFANIALRSRIRDDDVIDQLNHWATVGFLAALAIGTGAKQYVGDPIRCWVPAEYKKKQFQKYSDSYCWIHSMYNVPFDNTIPFQEEDRWFNDISYYRWVFIVFLIQAFLFKFPNIVWTEMKNYSGLNVSKVVGMAWETSMMTQEERDKTMSHIAIFIDRWLKTYSQYRFSAITEFRDKFSRIMFCFGKRTGNYLSGLYMFTKILYFANVIGQFFLLSAFLDLNFWNFGFEAIYVWRKKGEWQDHYNFPRIGLCDYKIRQLQNRQTFTLQCVLSINMFLEKMYLILWFWLMMMLVFNTINLCQWLYRGLMPSNGEVFIRKYLLILSIDTKQHQKLFVKFVRKYLRTDGVFMLRIVAVNTSELLTTDLMRQLWEKFKAKHDMGGETTHPVNKSFDPNHNDKKGGLNGRLPRVNSYPTAPQVEDNDDDLPPKIMD